MYPTERDIIVEQYRRIELMKRAEKELLIRIAQNRASNQTPIHHRMLVSLGTWLEQLGCRLKSNYMEVADLEIQRSRLS